MSDRLLAGRTAIVTGASRGLGFEVARHLSSCGAKVALCSRNESEVEERVENLRKESRAEVWGAVVDVSSASEVERFAANALDRLGPADIIVNNAAVLGPVGDLHPSQAMSWSHALDVNVKGVAFVTAAFREQLERSESGRVVNLSGGGVGGPNPMMRVSAYLTSKYAIAGLTEALAHEFAQSGPTVNAIAPGAFPTNFMDGVVQAGPDAAGADLFADATARSGVLLPAELKPFLNLLDYVISDAASHISGRLLSARWETPELLQALSREQIDTNLYRLRRIDDALFCGRAQ